MVNIPTYNIYIDESRIDNPEDNYMVVGGIFVRRDKVRSIQKNIKKIKNKHNFSEEIKWVSVNERKIKFLEELVEYLILLNPKVLSFNCIVINKEDVDYERYHENDRELAFFKYIYILLKQRIRNLTKYYIFLDFKPTSKERVNSLDTFLKKHIYFYKSETEVKHLQAYDSAENILIQIADLFTGAVGYHYNDYPENTSKDRLAKKIAKLLGQSKLSFRSPRNEEKFNIFKINLDN